MKRLWLCILCLPPLLASCDEKELCFDHPSHALTYDIDVKADYQLAWEYSYLPETDWRQLWNADLYGMTYDSLLPTKPTGLRCLVYNSGRAYDLYNLPADGGVVAMSPGNHSLLLFNNDTEYILFDDLDSSASATATTRGLSRSTYLGNSYMPEEENTVSPPDFLFGHYIASYTPQKSAEPTPQSVTLKPLVFRYLVRYEFERGIEHVMIARGALAGMASSVYLTDGHTGPETATLLYDCDVKPFGCQGVVNSFGTPDYPNGEYSRSVHTYALNLEVRLRNGKFKTFEFDVTDQLRRQPRGGVITVSGLVVTDEEADLDHDAFNVTVEGWGEYQDVPINF